MANSLPHLDVDSRIITSLDAQVLRKSSVQIFIYQLKHELTELFPRLLHFKTPKSTQIFLHFLNFQLFFNKISKKHGNIHPLPWKLADIGVNR